MNCLFPDCPNGVYSRGLCARHYHLARGLVLKKEVSWSDLENSGKCLVTRKRTSSEKSWFLNSNIAVVDLESAQQAIPIAQP